VADLLLELAREAGSTLVVVTHDPTLLERLPRVEHLVQGRLVVGARGDAQHGAAGRSQDNGIAQLTAACRPQ
jgi:ABC-type lipoprotein export system ATPase subunit